VSRVTVTIDRLVLSGIEPGDRQALVAGLKSELARLLAGTEAAQSRRTPVLRAGRMPLEPGPAGARRLGGGIAKAIRQGIGS